jgi:hypothetical protein
VHSNLGTTPGKIFTREWLVEAVAVIIFTASVKHAAVNFAQVGFSVVECGGMLL